MKLILCVALLWSVAVCEEIISEGSRVHFYTSDTDDDGDLIDHDYDLSGYRRQKKEHGGHSDDLYESSGAEADHDQKHHAHYDLGAHSAQGSAGSHHGNVKKYHDRGHYNREKKYGYEKAYGYDKVSQHHDKGGAAQSYGASQSHQSQQAQHKKGAQGGQSYGHQANQHQLGAHNRGQYGRLYNEHGHNKGIRERLNRDRNRIYHKYPMYRNYGFSSGIGGGIAGLQKNYGYGGPVNSPLYSKYFGNRFSGYGNNELYKHRGYGEGYDGDFGLDDLDGDVGIPYNTYGNLHHGREPLRLTGLGGGLGHHRSQHWMRQQSHGYRN